MRALFVPGYNLLRNGQLAKAAFVNIACSVLLVLAGTTPWLHSSAGLLSWIGALIALSAWAFVVRKRDRVDARPPRPPNCPYWMWLPIVLVAVAVAFNPTRLEVYRIPTSSCTPVLMPGDRVVADKWPGQPDRGAMVLFKRPGGQTFVKRLIAVAGDTVKGGPGGIRVNGALVTEVAVNPFAVLVPDGRGFVLGNNVNNSRDSREFGPIEMDTIIGRPLYVLWGGTWKRTLTTVH